MNIRNKLLLLGSLGLLGVLAISAVNISSLNAIRDEAKKISDVYVPQMSLLAEVDEDFNDARRLSLAFMAETRQPELDALEAGFDKEVREAMEGAEKYLSKGLAITEQHGMEQLQQDIIRYRQLVKASFLLQRQGLLDEARAASVTLRPFADAVTKRSQSLKESKLARIEQSDNQLVNLINQTLKWSAAIGLACLLLFLLAAYKISRSISHPLEMMRQTINHICQNLDLRQRARHKKNDEVGEALTSFNHLLDNLSSNMQDMRQMGVSMGSAAGQLQVTSHGLFEQASTTSQASASMAATVEQVASTIKLVAEHVLSVDATAQAAGQDAVDGSAVIKETIHCIESIAAQVKATATRIDNLNGSTENINSAVVMIKDIAEQTNLLALNAAIEAARAGESGRGFAVVADEVRKLAERTAQTTAQITATIVDIRQETLQSTVEMASAVQSVEEGVVKAGAANKAVAKIVMRSDEVKRQIGEITQSMQEQSQALGVMSADIERVANLAESSYQDASELADGSRNLHEHSQKMVVMLNRYQLA